MTDFLSLILPEVRAALSGPGGTVRKSTDSSPQPVPSWWLSGLGSSSLNDVQDLEAVELHIWRATRQEMEEALSSVESFKRRDFDGFTLRRESVVKVQEDENVYHATVTFGARVFPAVLYG